ncbi:MAG: LysR family transcriptional regulator [Paracoccaceae bacterium]
MRTLVAVLETGSFAAAGDQVGLSHSAISLQIKGMEEELGVPLFDRSQRPPVVTVQGRVLAEHARKTVAMFDAAPGVAKGDIIRGRLIVGAVPTVLASFLPAALSDLRVQHPDLRIEVRSGSSAKLTSHLQKGQLDVVVCTKPDQPIHGLDWHLIASEPFVVIAPADSKETEDVALLSGMPFIWFNRKTWAGSGIEKQLKARNIKVNATMEIDSLDAIASMVREGLGVSIVPECKGARAEWKGLKTVPFGDPPYAREVGALVPSGVQPDALITAFLGVLQSPH